MMLGWFGDDIGMVWGWFGDVLGMSFGLCWHSLKFIFRFGIIYISTSRFHYWLLNPPMSYAP